MESPTLRATDEYSASKATHPRVSVKSMEDKIERSVYFTGGEVARKLGLPADEPGQDPLDSLTVCILTMENGFTVIGHSAPASPENFDTAKGQRFAYEDAIKKLWPLEGYALRERLHQETLAPGAPAS